MLTVQSVSTSSHLHLVKCRKRPVSWRFVKTEHIKIELMVCMLWYDLIDITLQPKGRVAPSYEKNLATWQTVEKKSSTTQGEGKLGKKPPQRTSKEANVVGPGAQWVKIWVRAGNWVMLVLFLSCLPWISCLLGVDLLTFWCAQFGLRECTKSKHWLLRWADGKSRLFKCKWHTHNPTLFYMPFYDFFIVSNDCFSVRCVRWHWCT